MAEVRIGEIICAKEVEIGGERRLVIDAKVQGDVPRFLKELEEHGLTIFLIIEPPPRPRLGRLGREARIEWLWQHRSEWQGVEMTEDLARRLFRAMQAVGLYSETTAIYDGAKSVRKNCDEARRRQVQ